MKGRTLFIFMFFVWMCLIPISSEATALDGMHGPVPAISGRFVEDMYSQYSMMVYEGFVKWHGNDEFRFDLARYHLPFGRDNVLFEDVFQMSGNNKFKDSGADAYPVPEPATLFLFGIGLVLLAGSGRRLKKP